MLVFVVLYCLTKITAVKSAAAVDWDISLLTDDAVMLLKAINEPGNFLINCTHLEEIIHSHRRQTNFYSAKPVKLTKLIYDCFTNAFLLFDETSATLFIWHSLSRKLTVLMQRTGMITVEYDPVNSNLYWIYLTRNGTFVLMSTRIYVDMKSGNWSLLYNKKISVMPPEATSIRLLYQRYTQDLIVGVNSPAEFIIRRFNTYNNTTWLDNKPHLLKNFGMRETNLFSGFIHKMRVKEECHYRFDGGGTEKWCFSFDGCQLVDMDWNDDRLFIVTHCPDKQISAILLTNLTNISPTTYNTRVFYRHNVDDIKKISFGRNYYVIYEENAISHQKKVRITGFNHHASGDNNGHNVQLSQPQLETTFTRVLNFTESNWHLTSILVQHKFPHSYCFLQKPIDRKGQHELNRILRYLSDRYNMLTRCAGIFQPK